MTVSLPATFFLSLQFRLFLPFHPYSQSSAATARSAFCSSHPSCPSVLPVPGILPAVCQPRPVKFMKHGGGRRRIRLVAFCEQPFRNPPLGAFSRSLVFGNGRNLSAISGRLPPCLCTQYMISTHIPLLGFPQITDAVCM